jgi:DNA adenine methylase
LKKIHPFSYYGGKYSMLNTLIALTPPHNTYVEVFGGSGTFLLNKPPAKVEVYNDLLSNVVNFFRCLRNKPDELIRLLKLTPYARDEFLAAKNNIVYEKSDLEKARKFFIRQIMSFASRGRQFIWITSERDEIKTFQNKMAVLKEVSARLKSVLIENSSFQYLIPRAIKKYKDIFFYIDPPYLPESRVSNNDYIHELSTSDHELLLNLILEYQHQAKFLISGYPSQLYISRLSHFNKIERDVPLICNRRSDNGKHDRRTECLWFNYALTPEQISALKKIPKIKLKF